jgi:replicative DNA helicase
MAVQQSIEKIPPQSLEAEVAVLGSMLLDKDAISHSVERLNELSFYKEGHKKIFAAIAKLYNENKAVDLITVVEQLKKSGDLEEAGGASYITSLASSVPTSANILHYAKIVREKMVLRSLINSATGIVTECYNSGQNVDELLDKAEQVIFDIAQKKFDSRFTPIKDIIKSSIDTIDKLYQRKEHVTGVATGFTKLDMQTAGLQPSDLIIVAGRPSMGKSALASCIVEHVGVVEKKPVAFFSLEMSKEQLVQRLLCSHARVDAQNVRKGFLSQSDWPKLVTAAGKLSDAPIYIDDTPGVTVMELRAKARRLKAQHDIQLMVVDYLQLMAGIGNQDNRQQQISDISRSLKALARELHIPLIAISQLSRAVENRTDHRPQLSDLRESGAIEQDADVVILLLREEYYNPTEENRGKATAIIAKQRNGPVGDVDLAFLHQFTRFENLATRSDEEYVEAGMETA